MSNLGRYQDITAIAKQAGGVDSMLRAVGEGAVAKAAPSLLAKGGAVGAGLVAAGWAGSELWRRRKERLAKAEAAEQEIRAAVTEEDQQGHDQ
ncbi:hypothetical protein LG293_15950 (plasmid) [Citricoccus nitrophenolicus]